MRFKNVALGMIVLLSLNACHDDSIIRATPVADVAIDRQGTCEGEQTYNADAEIELRLLVYDANGDVVYRETKTTPLGQSVDFEIEEKYQNLTARIFGGGWGTMTYPAGFGACSWDADSDVWYSNQSKFAGVSFGDSDVPAFVIKEGAVPIPGAPPPPKVVDTQNVLLKAHFDDTIGNVCDVVCDAVIDNAIGRPLCILKSAVDWLCTP